MKWSLISWTAVVVLGYYASASAQSGQKLVAAYSSLSGTQAVLWLAKESGAFQRHGLDVDLIYISTGTKMVQALVGGAAPLGARLRGAEIKIIAVAFNTLALSMITQTDIRAMSDLKGKRLGISRFGSNTDFGTRYLLKKHNIADRDVTFLQFGEAQAIFAALQSGAIHGGVLSYPTTSAALRKGFRELVDFSDIGLEFPNSNVAVTDRFLQTQPDLARRFLMGYAEGLYRYKTDGAFTKRVMGKYLRVTDQSVLDETYNLFAPKMPRIPYPTLNGIRMALESLSDEPRAKTAKPEEFYDDTILRSLEQEGFFRQLYR